MPCKSGITRAQYSTAQQDDAALDGKQTYMTTPNANTSPAAVARCPFRTSGGNQRGLVAAALLLRDPKWSSTKRLKLKSETCKRKRKNHTRCG